MQRSIWATLGVAATRDVGEIRRAYAVRLKEVHPEDDAEGFQTLRTAYDQAMALARAPAWTPDDVDEAAPGPSRRPASRPAARSPEAGPAPRNAPEPQPEVDDTGPHDLDPPTPTSDARRAALASAWLTLERLVGADEAPDPRALVSALEAILYNPILDDLGAYLNAEIRLADLIARNAPRTDPLIDAADARFGWQAAAQERKAHPAIVAVMRRRRYGPHLAALAEFEQVVTRPEPPAEAELFKALNAVTTDALEDHELFLHTEAELCRMILAHAPRLDEFIGTIAGRMLWERRYYDPRVAEILRRREVTLATMQLRASKHPQHRVWRALQKPPHWSEALRAAIIPSRYSRIRALLQRLGGRPGGAPSVLPEAAVAGWRRYYARVKFNPFALTVLATIAVVVFTFAGQMERQRAQDVGRYYPPAALSAGIGGRVALRCGVDDDKRLTPCRAISESPAGKGFAAAALRLVTDGRLGTLYNRDGPQADVYDTVVSFTPGGGGAKAHVLVGLPAPALGASEDDPATWSVAPSLPGVPAPNVSGDVILRCHRGEGGRLNHCSVRDETPPHQGLGAYAVALAEVGALRAPPGVVTIPGTDEVEFDTPVPPKAPRPDDAGQVAPMWITPVVPRQVSGLVVLQCQQTASGALSRCRVAQETPRGQGLGAMILADAQAGRLRMDRPASGLAGPTTITVRVGPHPPPVPRGGGLRSIGLEPPTGSGSINITPPSVEAAPLLAPTRDPKPLDDKPQPRAGKPLETFDPNYHPPADGPRRIDR